MDSCTNEVFMIRTSVSCIIFLFVLSEARSHDLWLIPPEVAAPKQPVKILASIGMNFPESVALPKIDGYPRKFVVGSDGKSVNLKAVGVKDMIAMLEFEPTSAGKHIVAVETAPKVIELEAEKFNEYLVSDGLPHIFRLRFEEKTLNKAAKERYRKSPTTLVRVGDAKAGDWSKPLDLPLQIVPLQDPFDRKVGDTLRVKVYFQQKPLKDANVGWQHPGDGDTAVGYVRTNANGEALIPIAATGLMTIRLTHMTRPKTAEHEWESFWTTLTFRVP